MSAAFWNSIIADHAASQLRVAKPVTHATHRGWLIEENWLGEWEATHPDFDPTPVHLYDGPSDNRYVIGKTRAEAVEAIDEWIAEHGE